MARTEDVIEPVANLKKHSHITRFMARYRYNYDVHMLNELSKLAYEFYLEGYNAGLNQHPVPSEEAN